MMIGFADLPFILVLCVRNIDNFCFFQLSCILYYIFLLFILLDIIKDSPNNSNQCNTAAHNNTNSNDHTDYYYHCRLFQRYCDALRCYCDHSDIFEDRSVIAGHPKADQLICLVEYKILSNHLNSPVVIASRPAGACA